jgi:GGDEF domain-containing protein
VISLKKLLALNEKETPANARVVWLILEAIACNAVESDPVEHGEFQASLRALIAKMEQAGNSDDTYVLAGEAIKSIESYNRGVQRSLSSQMKELQSIVSLFTRSLLQVSKGSSASATKLHQIEHQIEKASQSEDLRTIKAQLRQSLEVICDEAAEQERRGAETASHVNDALARPESADLLAGAVAELDMVTGLPNLRAAERAIGSAIAANTSTYAVLLCVERVEVINTRFGFAIGDRVLMLFGQHLAQRLSKGDQLFRWRGPGFLALLDRTGPEISIRAEIARVVSARLEQEIELSGRSVLLPIASSWMMTSLAGSTLEKTSQKLDAFSAAHAGVSPNV